MKILILCAHTDDEVGCAGTIARMVDEQYEIMYVAFSNISKSLQQEGKRWDIAIDECVESMKRLEVDRYKILRYEVRDFPEYRQEILEEMIKIKKYFNPNITFIPSSTDIHQDHQVVHNEGLRAFKNTTVLGYELPQNIIAAKNTAFVKLNAKHINTKVYAISAYKSQAEKRFLSKEFIWGQARMRGAQCNSDFAEAFELIRMII